MEILKIASALWTNPLNRQQGRLHGWSRFIRWQLAQRLMPAPMAIPFVDDTKLLASKGMSGATGNWYWGLHEPGEMGLALHLLRPDDLFIDVGANVGSYTVLAAAAGAGVIAVEPVPDTYHHLTRNIAINAIGSRVQPFLGGVSDKAGSLRFTTNLGPMNHVVAPDHDGPALEVPVVTLDELAAGRAPTMLKVDVEGHEAAVIRGGSATLASPSLKAIIMETNSLGGEDLAAPLALYGFHPFNYDPLAREFGPCVNPYNTVFIRNEAEVLAICKQAATHRISTGSI